MAENTNTPVTMKIINSEQFKRANIRFNGKPAEEIREELKKEGWFYSRNHNVWYPKNDAAANSQNFANHIKETYFPDKQEVKIITEASEKDELVSMVQNGSSLKDILSKLSDMYGEEAVHEAFAEARNGIEAKKETEILKPLVEDADFLKSVEPKALEVAVVNKDNGDFIHIQQSDEYGWDYTSYTKDYKEIDGGVSDDVPDSKETEDIRVAAKAIIKDLYPSSSLSDWSETDWNELEAKIEEVEGEAYQKLVENKEKEWDEHDNGVEQARDEAESKEMNAELQKLDEEAENMERANGLREMEASMPSSNEIDETGLTKEQQEIRIAQSKFGDIVRESFLALSDEEKEAGTTLEQKNTRYEKWFRPMVDEIMTDIGNGNKEAMEIVNNFDMDRKNHVEGNKWYSPDEAWMRDVQYKFLPEMYEKVQDRIKAKYEAEKTPYVIMYSSESPHFPSENKVYTVKEFNEKLLQADSEFHNRKKYAEEKYGSADNYWDLERDDKLPEEDKGIQFGYDKTNFKFFNIPSLKNPEDTLSYEPSRYDIGDGNGSVFDYVRSTCSHDEFIEALNELETQLYFPVVTNSQREFVEKTVEEEAKVLKANLKEKMEDLDKAQNEYKELHKKWLIESSEAERVDEMLKTALDGIKETYDSSMNDVFTKVLGEYPFASNDVSGSEFLKYTANEAKKMAVNELYLPSREAQKAMNAEDYKTYNSVDWAKLRRIWEMFPANVNMTEYAEKMLQAKVAEKGMSVADTDKHSVTSEPSLFDGIEDDKSPEVKDVGKITNENGVKPELTQEEIDICKKVIPPSQFKFTMELTQGEEGDFFTNKMKEIAETYKKINSDRELVNEDGTHTLGFRYFLGDTEIMLSEIDSDGIGFGYNILNGDLQMSEWGSTSLEEIMKIPYMEMDYHTPKNATIEQMLYSEHPDYFTEYAPKDNKSPEIDDKSPSKELSWGELEVIFSPASLEGTDFIVPSELFEKTRKEVEQWADYEATYNVSETDRKKETVDRALWSTLDFHNFIENAEKSDSAEMSVSAHEECSTYSEEIADLMVKGEITSIENAQIYLNDKLLHSEIYELTKDAENIKEDKPYSFFVGDTANLDIGFGAEFETITGMTAEQAAVKFAELTDKGFSPFIGLNIPGDRVFDDKEGQGAGIFATMEREGIPSFYIGDSFVKELKENDEHAKNVIAAYKELYEQTNKYIMGVKKPDFVFEKEDELNRPSKTLEVYTFSPFGYEGSLVQVETDLRRGIPAYDIVGLADSAVKETRERIRYAFSNSGLDFPSERVLQSLSPADLRKDAPLDLSMAVGILGQMKDYGMDEPVLALGELELSGNIRPVRGAVAAVNTAKASGITNIVCDPETEKLLKDIDGINILSASNLKEVDEKLMDKSNFHKNDPKLYKAETVEFNDEWLEDYRESLENLPMEGHFDTVRAIEVAVAGKHNILTTGAPGCGKTLLTQTLMPALTPKLTDEEAREPQRIASLAGLDSPRHDIHVPAFRMPHQTATIEGICGGGPNCRPGEISLAHKGTLFMDETAEFRSSVIQMLRVPLESRQITLARAGRSTTYPADFQLAMAMNPCPCGCYGSHDKICLDSARSIEQYWKKISDPLLDRVEIKNFVEKDEKDTRKMSIEEMKAQIAKAYEIQRKRGVYNSHMTPEQIQQYCKLDAEGQDYLNHEEDKLTPRGKANLLKLSLTIANMDGREEIHINDLKEARELSAPVFEKPKQFVYQPEEAKEVGEKTVQKEAKLDDVNISQSQIKDAEEERKRITEPILNGERTGMYKAFKDFADKGVLDIQGATVKLAKNGGLTPTGWKQLQAAMEIYRSKKFETFRYIMIDRKTGEIADQLAITSHMPNFCNVSKPNDETLKQVISRAEEKDYLIAVCHNHPSGNTTESSFDRELTDSLDRSLRRNDGLNRFAGHIILDHDTFNLAVPSESRPGNCHWKKMEPLQVTEIDRFTAEPKPEWAGNYVGGTSALKEVAKKINDTESWNDEFIPVVFTNADRNISGVQYYSKSFFENESDKIRNEFQFAAMEAGAIGAFPVVTDSLWEKLGKDATDFEAVMKAHVMNDAFTDVAFNHTTMTEKYDIEAGRNYYSFYRDNSDRKIDVSSTWQPLEINPRLFPPEGVGQTNEKDGYNAKMPLRTNPEDTPEYINSKRHKRDLDYER